MKRKYKRIIAYILCVTLILGIDNFSSFFNHKTVTMAANKIFGIEETDVSEGVTELSSNEEEESNTDNEEAGSGVIEDTDSKETSNEAETTKKKEKKKEKQKKNKQNNTKELETTQPETTQPEVISESYSDEADNGSVHDISNDNMSGYAPNSEGIKLTDAVELKVGEKYLITSYDDWIKLSQISQTSTLEGMEFIVFKRESRYDDWTLQDIKIGCKDYPFSGTLYNYYSTTTTYTNTIIFDYLSSKAHIGVREKSGIKTFVLSYTGNVPAGLANNLVLDKAGCEVNIGENGTSNYYVKILDGTIVSGAEAGGLFANVYVDDDAVSPDGSDSSIYKINISGNGIDLSRTNEKNKGIKSVSGKVAGGLIGSIRGDIDVNVVSLSEQIASVSSTATSAGSFVGTVSNGVNIVFNNEAEVLMSANVTGNGYVGGLIGYIENSSLVCDKGIRRAGNTTGRSHTGGLIGYAFNSSCVIANYTQNNNTFIYQTTVIGANDNNLSVGGVIGKYYNDSTERKDILDISYIKTQNKDAAVYSQIKITAYHNANNKVGGLAGIIDSGNASVHIHDINTDTESKGENSFNANMIYNANSANRSTNNETGGLAGVLAGNNILIENIVFNYVYNAGDSGCYSNSLSGSVIGDIAARVGYLDNQYKPSKLVVKDIKVIKSYVRNAQTYHGGLFGFVGKSAVALQGNIDLSGVPFRTYANSQRASTEYALLASLRNRGFVAGYAEGSIIYLDMDCNYIRPVTYEEDGIIKEFNANRVHYNNSPNTGAEQMYCLDDIGNYGSLYRNVENVLDITKDISQIVTGRIDKEAERYVIDSLGDALRLSIAGNTVGSDGYPGFGGNCFVNEGETVPLLTDILSKHYIIKTDLKLQDAGIHGFVRNDNITDYPFTGIFEGEKNGEGQNPVITMDFISRQKYGGLFTYAKNAAFKNLDIKGNLFYTSGDVNVSGAGSLAAYAVGNMIVDTVNIYTNMKCSINNITQWDDSNRWSYGGMFGVYTPNNGTYECNNCVISPNFTTIRSNAHIGGMIGWVQMGSTSRLQKMSISGCTLSTKITSDQVYTWYCSTNSVHGREAGLISMISDTYYEVSYTSYNERMPVAVSNNTYGNIDITDMKISDAAIDLTKSHEANNNVKVSGGFLGYAWSNVDVNINNLSIDDSVFNSRGYAGGLISFAAGRYNLSNININSLAMNNVKGYYQTATYCSFLIGNGQNAYVTVKDYNIAGEGRVTYENYSNFDEIVGLNLRIVDGNNNEYISNPSQNVNNRYINGGIVNIIDEKFSSFTEGTYRSYINKVVKEVNKYTRYYYNLFTEGKDWNISVSGGIGTISTPEQWLTFHVASYANGNLARYFLPYLNNTAVSSLNSIQITSDLDMKGYSVYPTPLTNTHTIDAGGHTITLYGEELSDLEKGLKDNSIHSIDRNNELSTCQHYMMHAALFNEVKGSQTFKNIKLSGTAANIGSDSGALIAGGVCGNIEIKNIILENLRIGHYKDTKCGLLVSHIGTDGLRYDSATNIVFDGIKTEYSSYDELPAGAALIGYVGSDDAVNVKVTFKNMQVEDGKTDDKKSGKVFKYASYVYDYKYTDNLDINRCYMLYTFTEDDCKTGNVTFGDEIREGVQYLDKDRDKDDKDDPLNIAIEAAKNDVYIPYVFTERNIFVNPRNGNITEGCGTYEDPYIITNAKQFLTLYLYLTGKSEYNTMFIGTGTSDDSSGVWKVVPIGGDGNGAQCSNGGAGNVHDAVSYGTQYFPSRDDLRTAYYKICADIELNSKEDLNDKYIGSEFSGLGSSDYPFAGVIIGTNGSGNYTITLPKQSQKRVVSDGSIAYRQIEQSTVGLISYMNGGVVKDINIAGDDWEHSYYNITDCAGGIAARISGGDNIIDNVKVSINFNINNPHKLADGTGGIKGLGGLVGVVDNGSLILRNIQDGKIVENCLFTGAVNSGTGEYEGDYNELAGMLVGRVYDGFVIYEGYNSTGDEPQVLRRKELQVSDKYTDKYPLVNGFHIINGNVLDKASKEKRLTFTKSGNEYNALIKNGDQLEVLALALNSDAFSVFYCERNDHSTGYGYKSKCRRALYNDIGKLSSADRNLAVTYDDNKLNDTGYLYPYICYKYIDYTPLSAAGNTAYTDAAFNANNYEGYKTTLSMVTRTERVNNSDVAVSNIISNVNKTISDVAEFTTTYELETKVNDADKMFDVSGYDMSFRGIGGIYTKSYSDFRANFNGNNNYVKFYINRSFDDTIKYSGMFNELTYNQKVIDKNVSDRQFEIKDFTIKNSIVYNPNKYYYLDNADRAYQQIVNGRGTDSCATGGLAGEVKGAWLFKNITLTRDEDIVDKKVTADVSGYKCVGGLIGRISNTLATDGYPSANSMSQNFPKSNDIDMVNCNVNGNGDVDFKVTELGTSVGIVWAGYRLSYAGGLVGSIGTNLMSGYSYNRGFLFGNVDFKGCNINKLTVTAENKGCLGGFAGMIGVRYNSYTDHDSGWGAIGTVNVDGDSDISDTGKIANLNIISKNTAEDYSAGGIFGKIDGLSCQDYGGAITVYNYEFENINIDMYPGNTAKTASSYEGVGGVIGYTRSCLVDLRNINVTGQNVIGNAYTDKYAGGLIGTTRPTGNNNDSYYQHKKLNTLNINNCSLEGINIDIKNHSCGGFVGRSFLESINIGGEDSGNSINNSTIKTGGGSAGGIVGYIYGDNMIGHGSGSYLTYTANIKNVDVHSMDVCSVSGNAGGVIGYPGAVRQAFVNLKNIVVYGTESDKTEIISSSRSGGIVGDNSLNWVKMNMQGYIGVGANHDADNWTEERTGCVNIESQYSGGLIGYKYTGYSEDYTADILVNGCRIYSYINNGTSQPETYSGGLFGYLQNYTNITKRFNTVTVKNNIIFTGANNNSVRNRGNAGLGCGGLYGYLNIMNGTNTYMPYVTLENNSIGCYNPADAATKDNGWKDVTLESKEVQLYDAHETNMKPVSYDKIDNLGDDNIGDYSVAFGQFIGRLNSYSYSSQIFILKPQVTTVNTLGSIPVIDVGSNVWSKTGDQSTVTYGETAPYLYRKNCHIVYIDTPNEEYKDIGTSNTGRKPDYIDGSLLENGDSKYLFGDFKDMVMEYQNLNTGVTDKAVKNYNYIMAKRLNMYMPYNDENIKYSLCKGDNSYYNLTYGLLNDEGAAANILNGVPVLILDGLKAQSVGDYAAAILTNGGGVVSESVVKPQENVKNTAMNNFWSVSCKNAYIDTDGSIKPIDTSLPIFRDHKVSSIYSTDSNRLNLAQSLYDEFIQKDSSGGYIYTITLLCYKYTCPGAENARTETIYIPVFVKEKVTMNSYIRILSNEEYSLNEAFHNGYKNEVHISHDSTYTIYAEFIYDHIRLKDSFKNNKVHKSITFNTTVPVITKGTKFTLIDYGSGKSYYYTADGNEDNIIPFERFKDKDGDNYVQCSIGKESEGGILDSMCKDNYTSIGYKKDNQQIQGTDKYENVGIERFFIVVEPPEVENNSVFYLNISADCKDINNQPVDEFFNKNPLGDKEGIQVTYIPGPTIGFGGINSDTGIGTDGVTYIKGQISSEETVQIDANVEVMLQESLSPYWAEKVSGNTIDSSNSGKYLEVAITLLDDKNNIVAWPSGTNISFNGGPKQVLENSLIIYTYKDIERVFAMDSVDNNLTDRCYYYNINEDDYNADMRWLHKDENDRYFYYIFDAVEGKWYHEYPDITEIKDEYLSISNQCNVTLDFSVADIEDYSGKNYTVMMKLYRSDSPDYPNEGANASHVGDEQDSNRPKRQYSGIIPGESKRDLAAAISADDLIDLGINLYNKQGEYEIPFTNKLDFSGIIHKSKLDADIAECADKKYMVTYRLYKKTAKGEGVAPPEYGINVNENIADILSKSDGYQYEIMNWADAPFKLYDAGGNQLSPSNVTVNTDQTQSVIVTTQEFGEDEIKNGTNGTQYVTEWGMNLKIDTNGMDNQDLTNYMITATYVPYDKSEDGTGIDLNRPENDQQQTLFDYFIFTIAKLKTDL